MKRLLLAAAVFAAVPVLALADDIPASCSSHQVVDDVESNLPAILGITSPGAARIVKVKALGNDDPTSPFRRIGTPGAYVLRCFVTVWWSNGLVQKGNLRLYDDQYGQADIAFSATVEYGPNGPIWAAGH
ncbi:MAG TPA: hypothetical protein VNC39_12740 [Acidocella sp.]|uniref:hypothetical protein n=1 Tax=Acidocella sp. TaxID=50710 RepID=UPI002CE85B2F|nr:hypothetical protein [Acidocella sp.]HVE22834.1 hypothetical protein [Acidocella sp.]